MELVTVLTLNYNNPFLYESIDSVLNQTYSDIQYIIFDDCSQKVHFDVEEIKRYIETHNKGNIKKVVVKQNEKNMGIIKNLNRAMKYVKGKYIFHLAGDDAFYDSKVLEEWTAYFKETKAEIVTAYRAVYDEKLEKEICVLPEKEDLEILKTGNQKKFGIIYVAEILFLAVRPHVPNNAWMRAEDMMSRITMWKIIHGI